MLRVPVDNPTLRRTLRPLYAQHQATPWGGFLDPTYDPATDPEIYPGTVMKRADLGTARDGGEVWKPYDGTGEPVGLSALFMAPSMGVNEVTASGTNLFTIWVGGSDAVFEILSPAFDPTGLNTAEAGAYLTGNSDGLLTVTGATSANSIAQLVEVVSDAKIIVRLHRKVTA